MRVLAVIPARGGSKGIPRKNIVDLGGLPLVAHVIGAAQQAESFADVVVSTEDAGIADVARGHGAEAPFLRPMDLAKDDTPSMPVVQHAVREMEKLRGVPYDAVTLIQCTSPFTRACDLAEAIGKLAQGNCDSVVTVVEEQSKHPFRIKRIIGEDTLVNFIDQGFEDMRPRQSLPKVYRRAGGCYASLRHVVMDQNTLVGVHVRAVVVPEWTAIDVDSPIDLELARIVMQRLQTSKTGTPT
jgi:CMP-N,N'-diacetyllegionaminic acid synthase